jgi:heat shock protein HspQ
MAVSGNFHLGQVVKHQLFGKLGPKLAGEDDYQILLG